jgi:hypothetical protein
VLHLTNGDYAVDHLAHLGDVMAWREVLHEGPVRHRDPTALRRERAQFLGDELVLRRQDDRLAAAVGVTLWFEADLFDALLVWQISARLEGSELMWFGGERWTSVTDPTAVPPTLHALTRQTFAPHWEAFVDGRVDEIPSDPVVPAMDEIVVRLWEQLPWVTDGLTRSERQMLEADGDFDRAQAHEERPFLGDTWAFEHLERARAVHSPRDRPHFWLGGARSEDWVYDPELRRPRRAHD